MSDPHSLFNNIKAARQNPGFTLTPEIEAVFGEVDRLERTTASLRDTLERCGHHDYENGCYGTPCTCGLDLALSREAPAEDARDAQLASLRDALKLAQKWIEENCRGTPDWPPPFTEMMSALSGEEKR